MIIEMYWYRVMVKRVMVGRWSIMPLLMCCYKWWETPMRFFIMYVKIMSSIQFILFLARRWRIVVVWRGFRGNTSLIYFIRRVLYFRVSDE